MSKIQLESIKDKTQNSIDQLNRSVIPKVQESHVQMKDFHNQELRQFEELVQYIENMNEEMHEKQTECETYVHEISQKRKEREKLGQMSVGVLEAKSDEIKSKVKNIDAVSSHIKETVAKVKPERLVKLPVTGEEILKELFTAIYEVIYCEDKSEFNWDVFKKLALKHENGEDFIFRLVNVNFKDLDKEKNDSLLKLKTNPAFEHAAVNSKYSEDIIDLADWVDYVCLGYKFNDEKKKAEKEYDRIRKDIDKKSATSLQMSEKFWLQQKEEVQKHMEDLEVISSQIKAINYNLQNSMKQSDELNTCMIQKISEVNNEITEVSSAKQ